MAGWLRFGLDHQLDDLSVGRRQFSVGRRARHGVSVLPAVHLHLYGRSGEAQVHQGPHRIHRAVSDDRVHFQQPDPLSAAAARQVAPLGYVYSSRLWAGVIRHTNTRQPLVTVPSGQRFVVKFIAGYQLTGTGVAYVLYLYTPDTLLLQATPSAASTIAQDCSIVFHEGETIAGRAVTNDASVSLNGYVLTGTGGPPTPRDAIGALPA